MRICYIDAYACLASRHCQILQPGQLAPTYSVVVLYTGTYFIQALLSLLWFAFELKNY